MKGTTMKLKKYFTTKMKNRAISLFLAAVMIFSSLPLVALTVGAAAADDYRSVDRNTMDTWREYIGSGNMSTEFAGGIFADKSVFKDGEAFRGTGITFTDNEDKTNFLVALSAIGSNMDVTGQSSVPTDTMLVLDISGSMNRQNNNLAQTLVSAANEAMAALLSANANNRVGVVLYSDDATELLSLDHYTTGSDGEYLTYSLGFVGGESVGIDSNTRTSSGARPANATRTRSVTGGTYIQIGIDSAADEFVSQANNTSVTVGGVSVKRKPVMVLLSDGEPTYGSTSFDNPGSSNLGSGGTYSSAIGFVTQLTAAYTKERVSSVYESEMLFYTMGLGVEEEDVLNPADSSTAIDDLWEDYLEADVNDSISVQGGGNNRRVTKIDTELEQLYVDQYFEVRRNGSSSLASGLVEAFQQIVGAIQLESTYFPTLVQNNSELEGYITFRDKIGHHMNVTDVKGILLHNTLFSGAEMASQFSNVGALGTPGDPTQLGREFLNSVQTRLGIDDAGTAATLVALAYQYKQLYWESNTRFSNYIGWYADENYRYLGFWHEGHTSVPADIAAEAKYIVRSYGYLGETDEAHGVEKSDMMYTTVRVTHDIATGDEVVTFAVPAALLPLVTYHVTTDEEGELTELTVDGAEYPICLVYEVALADGIDPLTVTGLGDVEKNADGDYVFYTNSWEDTISYDEDNTYAYFTPSPENDRYYYTQPTAVYTNDNGSIYTGSTHPKDTGDTYYRGWTVYKKNAFGMLSTEMAYEPISSKSIEYAQWHSEEGHWHIPADYPHTFTDIHKVEKDDKDATETLDYTAVAFADVTRGYVTGYTLGNNGRLIMTPATGISISKTVETQAAGGSSAFEFTVRNMNSSENAVYDAYLVDADGNRSYRPVTFTAGKTTVYLNGGETLYIVGMTPNASYEVTETETAAYKVVSEKVQNVTVADREITPVAFVNTARGMGNFTVTKDVVHELEDSYFANETYTMTVTLTGIGVNSTSFAAAHSGDGTLTRVYTDESGVFSVTLKDEERLEVFDLPEGTRVKVEETHPGDGYTVRYLDNGVAGDGIVTVSAGSIAAVRVENGYQPARVYPVNVTVSGTKTLSGRAWLSTDVFTFVLQKYDVAAGDWDPNAMATATVNSANRSFDFNGAFADEEYTERGVYYYRVIEEIPAVRIPGVTYDRTVHSFGVHVDDRNLDGRLEITEVVPYRDTVEVVQNGNNWAVSTNFTNTYATEGNATVSIDLTKIIRNPAASPLATAAGFAFGLYDGDTLVQRSQVTTERGFTRLVMNYTAAGTYHYTLKEIRPDVIPAYWNYDTKEIPVTVVVRDNLEGGLEAVIYEGAGSEIPENATSSMAQSFENSYTPAMTELKITQITKVLEGRELKADEFVFGVFPVGGTEAIVSNTNDKNGVVDMPAIPFEQVGTFYYEIREVGSDIAGVTVDKTVYRIAVHVVDTGAGLFASYEVLNQAHNGIEFKNTYTATPVDIDLSAEKKLEGKSLVNDEFEFTLTPANAQGEKVAGTVLGATNQANGTVKFPTITLTEAGTYYYLMEEVKGLAGLGIIYDEKDILVTVEVLDSELGYLYYERIEYKVLGGASMESPVFTNKYSPASVTVNLTGEKTLTGKTLEENDFEFSLYRSNANWQKQSLIETKANAANGKISFKGLTFDADMFTAASSYYYVVEEVNGGATIDGVTYDSQVYRIRVDLRDDQMGYLHATVHVFDSEGIPVNGVAFENEYKVAGEASATIAGEKSYNGKTLEDDLFTFELYEADENYNVAGKLDSVKNTGKDFRFTVTGYKPEDIGQSFYYVVKEENAGATIKGISYDAKSYRVKVTVGDNGDGTLGTVVEKFDETGAPITDIVFTNKYEVTGTASATFGGEKIYNGGKTLSDDLFTFELYEADGNYTVGARLQLVKNRGKDFSFTVTGYKPEDIGQSFYYVVKEENAGATIDGVTYDAKSYRVKVTVVDNGDGTLGTVVEKFDETGAPVTDIVFTNKYEVTGTASATFGGEKELTGKPLTDGEFTFELYEADSAYAAGTKLQAVKNVGKDFRFTVEYQPADVGQSFYYVVKEEGAGQTISGVTFDSGFFTVKVEVKDNGDGTMSADATVNEGTIRFTNSFAANLQLNFNVKKTVKNVGSETLGPEGFEFVLTNTTAGASTEAKTDANGDAKFALGFTEADLGKTYTYTLKEKNTGVDNVSYSTVEYAIAVTISLDSENRLVAKITQDGKDVTEVVAGFENIYDYTPLPPAGPQTGDSARPVLWLSLFVLSAAGLAWQAIRRKKADGKA